MATRNIFTVVVLTTALQQFSYWAFKETAGNAIYDGLVKLLSLVIPEGAAKVIASPAWLFTTLFPVIIIVCLIYALAFRRGRLSVPAPSVGPTWGQEWHELRFRRDEFWAAINAAYKRWSDGQQPLQRVISEAQFPQALPLSESRAFANWVLNFGKDEQHEWTSKLNGFVSSIYHFDASDNPSIVIGNLGNFENFDRMRRDLSKFWDGWGIKTPIDNVIKEQNAASLLATGAAELKLLTFLEIARTRWRPTGATGKDGLFRLAKLANGAS